MCGIIGSFKKKGFIDELSLDFLIRLSKEIQFRGPDFFNYYLDDKKKFFIGHLRLSIIDPTSNANQPIISKNQRYIVSFNGEIYNFNELAKKLNFLDKSILKSDTRVLVEYIALFGVKKALKDIKGMYAIAIFDKDLNYLYLTRDFFGKKPIYYYHDSNIIFFSSTLKPIIKNNDIIKKIDLYAFDHYMHYGFCPNDKSIFENVKKVQPNTLLSFNLNDWSVNFEKIHAKHDEDKDSKFKLDINHLDDLIYKSVEKRFVADVPVCILLSSGIDSSLVAYYGSCINKNIETYTVGFEDKKFDESQDSKKISNFFGLKNNTINFNNNEIKDIIHDISDAFDEPFADSSQIPSMMIFKKISKYSKVCITGDGGDEIFYGYNRYQWFLIWHKFFKKNFFNTLKTKVLFSKLISIFENNKFSKFFFDKFDITTNKTQKFLNIFFNKDNIYESFLKLSGESNFIEKENSFFNNNLDNLKDLRNFDIDNYLVDDILTKVDRSSMYYSVEARSPLLDKDIYDYVKNSDIKDNIDIYSKKKILKKILKNKIPKEIISNKKKGFSIPLVDLMFGELKIDLLTNFEQIKHDERLKGIKIQKISDLIDRFYISKDYKISYQVWSFYVFFKWFNKYKKFINN